MDKHFDKIFLYPLIIGILLTLLGAIFNIQVFITIGVFGFLPLAIGLYLGLVGLFYSTIERIIPSFRGKKIFVGTFTLLFAIIFGLIIIYGGGGDRISGPCQVYRGFPTC